MSTLTEAAIFSKKASIWGAIGIAVIIFLMIFLGIFGNIKNALFPPPPLPATVAFGKLPRMDLSEGYKPSAGITYTIETVSGDLPALAPRAKIFEIEAGSLSFGTLEELKKKAASGGFGGDYKELEGGKVQFSDLQDANRLLTMDKATLNFKLTSNYANDPEIITTKPQSLESATIVARNFLNNFGISDVEFPEKNIKTDFLRIDGNSLTKVQSLSSANLVQVDFFRADLDKLPVIWPKDTSSLASVLVSDRKVVAADLNLMPIRKNVFATYSLKGTAKAFEDLKSGNGAFVKPIKTTNFVVSTVDLGYVESSKNDAYLEPVYLFHGPDDQVAYVGAVSDSWIK